jgi:hypothetical protein
MENTRGWDSVTIIFFRAEQILYVLYAYILTTYSKHFLVNEFKLYVFISKEVVLFSSLI